ncbi:MAG TPA: SpoIIE family protein phosphatase [Planctomycetota bacterium]|nr:SpoIIE family protein phosphatase [Planctomycetota bacterium]HNR99103.1 SpoIIE family protein phosphatase [Planctomycetota bacterium]HNU25860.1 SpoIIE family protein phosphatase [Planctomycetota bacterium]HOE29760.1 SpoIIE family protein phosphatase [Planctomycetota bacterium]HOE87001.1 SpoIIE family protein phosphatase [Planctomycetota bacterium]
MVTEKRAPPHARSDGPRRPTVRLPIAIKLVVALVALTVGVSLWQGLRDFAISRQRLDEAKNQSGALFVRHLAASIPPYWRDEGADPRSADARDRARVEVHGRLKELVASPVGADILDIVIFAPEDPSRFYMALTGQGSFTWTQGRRLDYPAAADAGVTIHEGVKGSVPVRSFTSDMTRNGVLVGRIAVYLSAADIQAAEHKLWGEVVRSVIAGIAVAAAVSILLGMLLTRPIRALARDMRAVGRGNLDCRSTVGSGDEVGDLARTFNHMVASLKDMQERRAAQKAMEKELGIARAIQKGLMPERPPELRTWDVAAQWLPAREIGGDYYDFLDLREGAWGLAVADVSGKGIPAALIMSMMRCLLRLAVQAGRGPSGTIDLVEEIITPDLKDGMFVSMAYLRFAEDDGEIRLVRAGHNPPIVVRARTRAVEVCNVPGVALGLRAGFGHAAAPEAALALEPGDCLVLYSDGITEAMNAREEEYGQARFTAELVHALDRSAAEIAAHIVDRVAAWRGAAPQSDDITLAVLKRRP